ncbi:MAG: sugar ABC transporter substrate-binding protein [Spirochaetia bacterium]|jgi:ribose transport system substrate-binding protein
MKRALTLAVVLVIGVFLISEASAAGKKWLIGKIPITMQANYHQAHVKWLQQYAKQKYNADVNVIDGEFSTEASVKAVETFISQGVDGIALHSLDEKVNDQMVKAARKAKIPIITFYIPTFSRLVPHLQINEGETSFMMGKEAATKWHEFYPNKKIYIAVIDYLTIEIVQKMRTGPFIAGVLAVDPTAQLVAKLEGAANVQKSMAAMQDILQAHPEVNIVYGANADHALGALAALENAGRGKAVNGKPLTEIVVGTDATEGELAKLYDPNSSFKITQGLQPKVNAMAEMDLLAKVIQGSQPADEWMQIDTFNKFISYWQTPIEEAQKFLSEQYFYKGDLKSLIGK